MPRSQASSTRLNIEIPVNSKRARKVTKTLEHEFIRGRVHNKRLKKRHLRSEMQTYPVPGKIAIIEDRTRIQQYLDESYEHELHMVKTRQITKMEKMKTQNMKIQAHDSPVKSIVNFSKWQLTTPEKSVLNKVLNFATTIERIPYLDLIAPIDDAALKISKA